jgi:hypothetical protein
MFEVHECCGCEVTTCRCGARLCDATVRMPELPDDYVPNLYDYRCGQSPAQRLAWRRAHARCNVARAIP